MPASPPRRIEVTPTHLLRDGVPWFPVTGEIHYSRIPRARWDEVLGHARAGGLTTVATYFFWQAHEPTRGDFRWDDNELYDQPGHLATLRTIAEELGHPVAGLRGHALPVQHRPR